MLLIRTKLQICEQTKLAMVPILPTPSVCEKSECKHPEIQESIPLGYIPSAFLIPGADPGGLPNPTPPPDAQPLKAEPLNADPPVGRHPWRQTHVGRPSRCRPPGGRSTLKADSHRQTPQMQIPLWT